MSDEGDDGMDEVEELLGGDEAMGLPADAEFDILHGSREEILDELYDINEEHTIYQIDYQLGFGKGGTNTYVKKGSKRELFVAYGPAAEEG